jgi:hypothetical protein
VATKKAKRSNGDGSVVPRKLKSGKTVYDVYVSFHDPVTGVPGRYIKKGFETKTAADKHRREKVTEAQRATLINPSVQPLGVSWTHGLEGTESSGKPGRGTRTRSASTSSRTSDTCNSPRSPGPC